MIPIRVWKAPRSDTRHKQVRVVCPHCRHTRVLPIAYWIVRTFHGGIGQMVIPADTVCPHLFLIDIDANLVVRDQYPCTPVGVGELISSY